MNTVKNAPGKHYRKGISLVKALLQFGDDAKAEAWFVARRWPNGPRCTECDGETITPRKGSRVTPQYHCKSCKVNFTVKTGTVMHSSNLPLSKWALAFYLYSTSLKGVSSMKLHGDLDITQKSAWYLAHRIRETWNDETERMAGPVEADESYFGGLEGNKHKSKRLKAGRGPVGKTAVAGLKDRSTNQVKAQVVDSTDAPTLQGFVQRNTDLDAEVYTDEARAYVGLPRRHEAVRHSVGEYVKDKAHTNGMESFWSMLKRGHDGVYHHFSPKHLNRYVHEFEGRHNARPLDTAEQMSIMAAGTVGKRLTYSELIGPKDTRQPRMV